ncbi:methyltransferase [Sphingobacterium sp. DN00404]|uniref:Methyltransferase n=1 Tax=Sphingobacterium micropteri TaxID=2763501 RepID=A0ABR7YU28_9SPHI|nr:DUF6250 domain-containing protein [Sphingobacterium micropteri]MBD1434671.1 methyltransferase [Sphingobacterium micropteri]
MRCIYAILFPIWILTTFVSCQSSSTSSSESELLFEESFEQGLDSALWIAEIAPEPGSQIYVADGKLWLDTYGGVTVWLNHLLEGNFAIEYERTVVVDTSSNDRLSDLNQFWMASDPSNENLFSRSGVFESYDSLSLYYVGMGGNNNTTTRFRKYEGDGTKPLLYEHDRRLEANHTYRIRTEVINGVTTFSVDGQELFSHRDPDPLTHGYFGLRSTYSRQAIDNVRIYRLNN